MDDDIGVFGSLQVSLNYCKHLGVPEKLNLGRHFPKLLSVDFTISNSGGWARQMAQWAKVLATKPDYLNPIPGNPHDGRREQIPASYSPTST